MNSSFDDANPRKYRADMHTHTDSSPDSECDINDLCRAQIEKGISTFAITDHFNIEIKGLEVDIETPIVSSYKKATDAAEKYSGKIEVLRGIEVGAAMWDKELAEQMLKRFDFDVVIGSVHTVYTDEVKTYYSQVDFSTLTSVAIDKFMTAYFDELLNTALYCDFDILAHLTCPVRYINGKYNLGFDISKYEEVIREILSVVIKRDKALEVNTSNCSFSDGFFMPDSKILSIYKEMGGSLLTMGSDAHVAQNSAIAFDEAEQMLTNLGFSELCVFRKRCPFAYPI